MKKICLFLCALLTLMACNDGEQQTLPASKGLPCELLVVCDAQVQGCDLRDSVETITESDALGLGAGENIFRVNKIGKAGYTRVFWAMHSKVFFEIDSKLKAPQLGVAYDVKAKPQIEMYVKAPNVSAMRQFLSTKRSAIQQTLMEFQVQRLSTVTAHKYSKKVYDDLRKVAGYTVKMPTDMIATKKGAHFLWGGSNRNQRDINFLFYTYPWDGSDIMDAERFVHKRDSVLQVNIPGSTRNQWMTTSRGEEGQPVIWPAARRINGQRQMEVRGLWELHGGFMGGPFIALVSVDTLERQVVVAEGFVYNPEGQKRDLMRQLEGALRTLKKEKQTDTKR